MKSFVKEFKEFISKGSVIDLAVGIIIGSAFTAIVDSLVNNVIMPLISVITGGVNFESWNVTLGSGENAPVLALGSFIAAILNFFIIALVIFIMISAINRARALTKKAEDVEAPATKECPFCKSSIPVGATRCPHCTSLLEE